MESRDLDTSEKVNGLYGSAVKTNSKLESWNFAAAIADKHIASRRPNAPGIVIAQPNQCGGDAFVIDHQDGTPAAVYWFTEFEKV